MKTLAAPLPKPLTTRTTGTRRLMSVDALRGFDMFWIIGADALVRALDKMGDNAVTRFFAAQLTHKEWAGFAFYDLIFPLFIFLVGVSLVFSLSRTIEQEGREKALMRVFRRGLLLVLLGIFYSGGLSKEWPDIRLLGVLQRIGLAYLFAGLFFCFFRVRGLVAICAGLLIGYWALMAFVPIRGIQLEANYLEDLTEQTGIAEPGVLFESTTYRVKGQYEKGLNLANHLDFQYLPGRKYDTYWDPEGLLSTLPAIATCLLGVFAGLLLRSRNYGERTKVMVLVACGTAAVLVGLLWGLHFPVVKKIWTSSFVLVAGGYSAILLGVFHYLIEVWPRRQAWCQVFVWIGMNAITIYLANNIIGFRRLADRLVGGDVKNFFNAHVAQGFGDLVLALAGLGIGVLLAWFLYRQKIFLRL